jgi:DNA-binding transcriptional MerR regulator/methylmalonyl-CoA mutase cobalamin-binding subunit
MYSIGHAAEQVGISAATLRAWERRYAVVEPKRTAGDYRVYSNDDLRVLRAMKQLIDAGWSSSLAAQEVRRTVADLPRSAEHTGPVEPDLPEQFVAAAATLDSRQLEAILDRMFSLGSYETAVSMYLFPALRALGDAWAAGRVTVAGEHLASHAVGRRLASAFDAAASARGHGRVLMGLPPGCHHELGLLAFAVAARRHGLDVDYLGADVPVADWVTASAASTVSAVALAIPAERDVGPAAEVAEALRRQYPELLIAAGGAAAGQSLAGVMLLGDDISGAAEALAQAVAH